MHMLTSALTHMLMLTPALTLTLMLTHPAVSLTLRSPQARGDTSRASSPTSISMPGEPAPSRAALKKRSAEQVAKARKAASKVPLKRL